MTSNPATQTCLRSCLYTRGRPSLLEAGAKFEVEVTAEFTGRGLHGVKARGTGLSVSDGPGTWGCGKKIEMHRNMKLFGLCRRQLSLYTADTKHI